MRSPESPSVVEFSGEALDKNAASLLKEGYEVLSRVPEVKHILGIKTKKPRKGASSQEKIDVFIKGAAHPSHCYFRLGDYFYYTPHVNADPDELTMTRYGPFGTGFDSSFTILADEVRKGWGYSQIRYHGYTQYGPNRKVKSEEKHYSDNQMAIDKIKGMFGQMKKDLEFIPKKATVKSQ